MFPNLPAYNALGSDTMERTGALYIRVSSHDQDELSPDAQIRLGLDFAKQNDIYIPKDYIFVESVSGRKVKNRHEFQRMIALAKSPEHPIDVVIVWKFSRFARNQEESIVYKSMLKKDKVDVISISEPLVDGPFGSLIERIIEWMDEYYSIRLSGEVLRGMGEKALRNGYQFSPPLGYKAVGHGEPYIINEEEFQIVQYIFEQFDLYNKDYTSIARSLNSMGRITRRGNLFEARTIERILKNPFYYGLVSWNGSSFIGTHEVRLSEDQFQARMDKIRKSYKPDRRHSISTCRHWVSGILKCGYCGSSLSYNGRNNRVPGFQCYKYAKGIHDSSCFISEKKVLSAVSDYFESLLHGADFQYRSRTPQNNARNSERELLIRELEKISAREQRVRAAYEDGIDTLEEYKSNRQRLALLKSDLNSQIDALKSDPVEPPSRTEALHRIQSVYDIINSPAADYEAKGTALRSLVESIVYDKENQTFLFTLYVS